MSKVTLKLTSVGRRMPKPIFDLDCKCLTQKRQAELRTEIDKVLWQPYRIQSAVQSGRAADEIMKLVLEAYDEPVT